MAWTQADVDALKAVIGTGVLTVTYDGPPKRSITYQSTQQMIEVLSLMEREVARADGRVTSYTLAATRKGL